MSMGEDLIQRIVNLEYSMYGIMSQPPPNPPEVIIGGGGGGPAGDPYTLQFNDNGVLGGVPNSSVDPVTGDVTLGAGLLVISGSDAFNGFVTDQTILAPAASGNPSDLLIETISPFGITIDATGFGDFGGTGIGPITLTSAGGVSITDNEGTGTNGILLQTDDLDNGILVDTDFDGGGINIWTTQINGIIAYVGSGPGAFRAGSSEGETTLNAGTYLEFAGPSSTLDIDATTPGVITASTVINAIEGYQANNAAGISGSGTSMTNVTVIGGLITAATFA